MSYHSHFVLNSLTPKSDQHPISPYIISPESNIYVTRIEKMIINLRRSWLLNKFSPSAPKEIYRAQYEEYVWFWGVKG